MNIKAHWFIELRCDCPQCGEYIDLTDEEEFWHQRNLAIGGVVDNLQEVKCPECGAMFDVDIER